MALLTVSDAGFVQIDGRRLLVRCCDPDTGDVVALWPSEVSEDPGAPGHFVAASIPQRHHPGEYLPEDDPGSWPTSGPCAELPTRE